MQISKFRIINYMSLKDTGDIQLDPFFNIVAGKNNSGKSALVKALSLSIQDRPHRSVDNLPTVRHKPQGKSGIDIEFSIPKEELMEYLSNRAEKNLMIAKRPDWSTEFFWDKLIEIFKKDLIFISGRYQSNNLQSAFLSELGHISSENGILIRFETGKDSLEIINANVSGLKPLQRFPANIMDWMKSSIYYFSAERLNLSESHIEPSTTLNPNASNLAQVLNILQANNPSRFERYNKIVREIFPDICQVTAPIISEHQVQIKLWPVDPKTEREDLAIPLRESGTGIGQVLAMLYVLVTSNFSRTIIIDEPQSFIHPGAIHKLLQILKREKDFSQHQYIIATHSPAIISNTGTNKVLLLRKEGPETKIDPVSSQENRDLNYILSEVGARLSDVFGADKILWVEGATEENCFPLIAEKVGKLDLTGTKVIGVVNTGDFEGKDKERILRIYRKLSNNVGLLPPAVGFIFDRENRSEEQVKDIERVSKGLISFLHRKMFENYLLDAEAIVSVMNDLEGFRETPVTEEEVRNWIETYGSSNKYINQRQKADWSRNVHAADLLQDLFKDLSGGRCVYNKISHGVMLTNWLIAHSPEKLEEVAEIIGQKINQKETITASRI